MNRRVGLRILGAIFAGALIAGVGVGVSGGLVTTSSQPQPDPTVAVSPNVNLRDLQSVLVVASHFSPNAFVGSVECIPKAVDESSCDLSTLVYANANPSGAFTLHRAVRRLISVAGGTVDCAKSGGCVLGVGNVSNFSESAGAPISFDPKIPPIPTKLTAKPATALRDHQLITVNGQGFNPGSGVSVVECTADNFSCAYETSRQAEVSATGTLSITNFALERKFLSFDGSTVGTVDCAASPHTCTLVAENGGIGGFGNPISAPLSFDPKIPAAVPAITVSPSTNLGDLQLLTVNGFGFFPGASVSLAECSTATFACDPGQQFVTAGFQGKFALTISAHRRLAGSGPGGVAVTDCASHLGACAIISSAAGALDAPSVFLSFDPRKPARVPDIAADHTTDLVDNQKIRVTLDGFPRYRPIAIVECGADAIADQDLSYCDGSTEIITTTPALGGRPSGQIFVHRQIAGRDGLVDCTARPGACVLVATPYEFYPYGGGVGGGGGGVVGGTVPAAGGLKAAQAPPSAFARPTAGGALPVPAVTNRPLVAAKGSTIPGIASVRLTFHR